MSERYLRVLIVLLGAALLAFHLLRKQRPDPADVTRAASQFQKDAGWQGRLAPDIAVETLGRVTFKLSEHIGREVVILNFFATWSAPCRAELPELDRFAAKLAGKPLAILAIDGEERADLIDGFWRELGISVPVAIDTTGEIRKKYGVDRIKAGDPSPTPEDVRKEYGPRAEYDLGVMGRMAAAAGLDTPERRKVLERMCDLQADECLRLADELITKHLDDEAARALRRAFEAASDRVRMANSSRFLVRYYFDRKRMEEATRVAEAAEQTGSGRGMDTMGELLEWQGKFAEAESRFRETERRYQDADGPRGFYQRMVFVHHDLSYESRLKALMARTFPNGLERVDPKQLPQYPPDGTQITSPSPRLEPLGLHVGDVIVAFDGWRVHNEAQYDMVEDFDRGPDMRLLVYSWRQGRYIDVQTRIVRRQLGVNRKTYSGAAPGSSAVSAKS